jgi:hypothetical protein
VPVGAWSDPEVAYEGHAHLFFVVEAAAAGHLLDPIAAFLECSTGRFDTQRLDHACWGAPPHLGVAAGKIARAHTDAIGETLDAQVSGQVLGNPSFQLAEGVADGIGLSGQKHAVLRLSTRAAKVDDQHARNVHRDGAPAVLFD